MNVYWDSLFQNYRWSKTSTQNRISHVAWGEFILPTKQFLFQCVKYQGWVLWADCFLLLSFLYADLGMYFQLLLDFCCIFCSSSRQEGFGGLSCKGLSHWILFSGRSALHWPQQGPNPSTGFSWSWLFFSQNKIALEMKTFYIKDYPKYLFAAHNQRCIWVIDNF